jgi:predicted transcriptional regulator
MTLLSLPDHLRKTAMILNRLSRATASQVAQETKRARAVESSYLNQLVVMGHIHKTRQGRDVYFYLDEPPEERA